jgi:hypothetical protein
MDAKPNEARRAGLPPVEQLRIAPERERPAEAATPIETTPPLSPPAAPALAPSPPPPAVKSHLEQEIEAVLAEDLEELYWELPEPERLIFKHRGEETASQIRLLLGEARLRVQEIFRLLVEWLKLLPGVSQFFVEQEAKIKTDKLLKFR